MYWWTQVGYWKLDAMRIQDFGLFFTWSTFLRLSDNFSLWRREIYPVFGRKIRPCSNNHLSVAKHNRNRTLESKSFYEDRIFYWRNALNVLLNFFNHCKSFVYVVCYSGFLQKNQNFSISRSSHSADTPSRSLFCDCGFGFCLPWTCDILWWGNRRYHEWT